MLAMQLLQRGALQQEQSFGALLRGASALETQSSQLRLDDIG